ncbi:hypothetical protein Egran_01340 [Elaphomyces granulatus]|uniref:Mediator of RNA polymerase II transcription subunit 22 n=1 Tax=Elaphomyces granulatus TaxID=519963 RepID=A0A232M3G4_9EURO|nr:hypothetical protein Egran_01340 [Elaphomyces granulatus]
MDSQPTSKILHNRINTNISQLLQRFENIMATAAVLTIPFPLLCKKGIENPSYAATAIETYQLDVESTALIRAAEDILSLTRTMKETWLFGKLDTLGEDERDIKCREKLEGDALTIKKTIEESGVWDAAK